MKALRWSMVALCFACVLGVASQAYWITRLSAPRMALGVVHRESAPLWSPPPPRSVSDVRETVGFSSDWRRVDAATVTTRVETLWEPMLGDLLLLLVPATLLPGWLYTRVRGRHRDLALHLGLHAGSGLALGLLASVALWFGLGGWGPPMFSTLGILGLGIGLATGALAYGRRAAPHGAAAGDRSQAGDRG
jgi:hypothetical protein